MKTTEIPQTLLIVIIAAAILELIMKGVALWKAAKANQNNWFVVLLLINSAGILPFIYLKYFKKINKV